MADGEALASTRPVESSSASGGPGPMTSLFASLSEELRRFVLGVVRDPSLADDVMQSTFVKALEHGHEARGDTARGWLFRVAFREALAIRRRSASLERGRLKLSGLASKSVESPDGPSLRGESIRAVREAIGGLPEEYRKVVLARIYDEKTFAQIAAESGLPLGTVLTRMRRALDKMRKSLKKTGD